MTKAKKTTNKQIEQLQSHVENLENDYKRALADYQNLVKQTQKERQEYIRYANSSLIEQLLPILDNLKMAYKHLQDPGVEMIIKQFHDLLKGENIEEISAKPGDEFDHDLHEAIDSVEGTAEQNGRIAELSLVGYKYQDGLVLRHAKVKVFKLDQES